MDIKNIIKWDDILLNYKISAVHLRWICVTYNFKKGNIPREFLDSLVCCTIVPTNALNIGTQKNYNFNDYKHRIISIPLNRNVWIPDVNLQLIKDQSLQLCDQDKEQYHEDVTTTRVKFRSTEKLVHAFTVEDVAAMSKLKRTEEEVKTFATAVKAKAAEVFAATEKAKATEG